MQLSSSLKPETCFDYLCMVPDPRHRPSITYPIEEILFLILCASMCGFNDWVSICTYGRNKIKFLKKFFPYENEIPSHDAVGDVMAALDFKVFQEVFIHWVQSLNKRNPGLVAIDGKQIRRSYTGKDKYDAVHMVSAWSSDQNIVLAQEAVAEKSNEITAIPNLLDLLVLEGAIVTVDAMGCQKEIAQKIREKKADYILALKGNQGSLHEDICFFFEQEQKTEFKNVKVDIYKDTDAGHGRIEERECIVSDDIGWLKENNCWNGLNTIVMIKSKRIIGEKVTEEKRYYISSLAADAKKILHSIRSHWGVENSLHWRLDMNFQEDTQRMRMRNSAKNFAVIKHMIINILDNDNTKISMKQKINTAALNEKYLCKLLKLTKGRS